MLDATGQSVNVDSLLDKIECAAMDYALAYERRNVSKLRKQERKLDSVREEIVQFFYDKGLNDV